MTYNAEGKRTSLENLAGQVTTTAWDSCHKVSETYPVRYTYDIFGNKTTMTTYRDETSRTGGSPVQGDVTTWLYDIASGSMTNKAYADGKGPSYTYTPDGKLAQRTWARGIVTDYSYDNWGSLTNTVYSDNTPTVSLSYDAFGRQTEARDAAGLTAFLYDSFGSLTNETVIGVAGTNSIDRFYDNFGRDTGYALNGVRQSTHGYDSATARLLSMQISRTGGSPVQDEATFSWSYLPGSDLKSSLSYPNGLSASWTYDANNQLLQVCNATPTNIISQYDYMYDAAGRRVSCAKSGSAFAQNDTIAYGYNNRGELTNAVAAVDADYRYAYNFDDIGNRETAAEQGTNVHYSVNALNQYSQISSSAASALSAGETFNPQFDDDGNQTLIKTATGIWSVTYNGENRPILWENISTNSSTPTPISMSYDRLGRRVTKSYQRFVYDGYLQIANFEHQTSSIKLQTFIWDPTEQVATRPLLWNNNSAAVYYVHDGNKNVSEAILINDSISAHYEYTPFGAVRVQYGEFAIANHWLFSSEYAEVESGTVYYNYRYYEPIACFWICRDPANVRLNFNQEKFTRSEYSCIDNNPIDTFDRLGLITEGLISTICCEQQKINAETNNPFFVVRGLIPCCPTGASKTRMENCGCLACAKATDINLPMLQGGCLPGAADGPGDALRHCIWSCMMKRRCGGLCTWLATTYHESFNPIPWNNCMDLANNSVGRDVAGSSLDCGEGCLRKFYSGELTILTFNPEDRIPLYDEALDCINRSKRP